MNKPASKQMLLAVLLTLSALLQACATPSPPSAVVIGPQIPSPPVGLMLPPPQEDWLGSAAIDAQRWQKQLTASEPK